MARTQRTRVRWWRWRRNALRRRSDVVEAWVVLAAWTVAVVGGLLAGLVTQDVMQQSLDRQRLVRHAVTAVLAEDAVATSSAITVDDQRVWVTARWTASDGSPRSGQTRVPLGSQAGSQVTVWTDEHDALASKPVSHTEAVLQSALAGALAVTVTGGVVWGAAQTVRVRLDRRRMDQWADEWERIDTWWGRKTG
ncbi:Rv1733c family protein [Streptomyces albicerus]|uniref:Rv1733c family protein n=1 Tax=Streptomyces albicerus TaxID=2569859 RepID=UPI001CED55CD|nr:hypothetical protein [Streptomyces albicerus]